MRARKGAMCSFCGGFLGGIASIFKVGSYGGISSILTGAGCLFAGPAAAPCEHMAPKLLEKLTSSAGSADSDDVCQFVPSLHYQVIPLWILPVEVAKIRTTHYLSTIRLSAQCFTLNFYSKLFEISRYMYIRNGLLIRLLKTLRQPTTGFALLGAHQRRLGAAHSVSWKHRKQEIQLGSSSIMKTLTFHHNSLPHSYHLCVRVCIVHGEARWPKWLEREFTDRKVRGSNPTSNSRLPLSRFGQPGSVQALGPRPVSQFFITLVFRLDPTCTRLSKYPHLHINLVFAGDPTLVYDGLLQLNVLHQAALCFNWSCDCKNVHLWRKILQETAWLDWEACFREKTNQQKTPLSSEKYTRLQIDLVLRETHLEPS
ncbi:hypothetical protein CSKR_106996 [Clonorchis sinensis]|uniref:Uncharacterized protein n=1 Tax=Clonorchis sinensis TaxID=79923 RepID=A0A8T1MW96_CLOSI|nr:hypothetical protein CSKR_106996 [Clonorchis sinensis]